MPSHLNTALWDLCSVTRQQLPRIAAPQGCAEWMSPAGLLTWELWTQKGPFQHRGRGELEGALKNRQKVLEGRRLAQRREDRQKANQDSPGHEQTAEGAWNRPRQAARGHLPKPKEHITSPSEPKSILPPSHFPDNEENLG